MTYEMIGVADENGRTYKCKYGTYNREDGFEFNEEFDKLGSVEDAFCVLVHCNIWSIVDNKKKMTKEDIEKALGYKIEIIEDENKPVPPKCTSAETPKPKKHQVFFDEFLDELLKDY